MNFVLSNINVANGRKSFGDIYVTDSSNRKTKIPFYIVNGSNDGPVVCITAGIHGTEYPGIETALRLYRELDPQQLNGVIICCPICNFESFRNRSMFMNPLDLKNLNNVFPGDPQGTITEVIADKLLNGFVARSKFHIDMHSGDSIEDLYPYVFYHKSGVPEVDEKSAWMAETYGLDYIAVTELLGNGTSDKGNFYSSASENGISSIQPEVGGLGLLKEETVRLHYTGVKNILAGLHMIKNHIIEKNPRQIKLQRFIRLRSQKNGIFYSLVKPGQKIRKRDHLALIFDYWKDKELERYEAECDGVVLWVMSSPAVKDGDALMAIGIIE